MNEKARTLFEQSGISNNISWSNHYLDLSIRKCRGIANLYRQHNKLTRRHGGWIRSGVPFFAVTGRMSWRLSSNVNEARTIVPHVSRDPFRVGTSGRSGAWSSKPIRSASTRPSAHRYRRPHDGESGIGGLGLVTLTKAGRCQSRHHRRVPPQEIEAVHQGLPAQVILSACRQQILPRIEGVVQTDAANRLNDEAMGELPLCWPASKSTLLPWLSSWTRIRQSNCRPAYRPKQ